MGNRAVITTAPYSNSNIGVYVHWNGGPESIEGFVRAARKLGYRTPGSDSSYALARLVGALALYFGAADDTSLGLGLCKNLDTDNGDNGTYLLGGDWEVIGRKWSPALEPLNAAQEKQAEAICNRIVTLAKAAQAISDSL